MIPFSIAVAFFRRKYLPDEQKKLKKTAAIRQAYKGTDLPAKASRYDGNIPRSNTIKTVTASAIPAK